MGHKVWCSKLSGVNIPTFPSWLIPAVDHYQQGLGQERKRVRVRRGNFLRWVQSSGEREEDLTLLSGRAQETAPSSGPLKGR